MSKYLRYIPAFHFHWLTRWYDPMMLHLFPEEAVESALIAQAHIQSGQEVLDIRMLNNDQGDRAGKHLEAFCQHCGKLISGKCSRLHSESFYLDSLL